MLRFHRSDALLIKKFIKNHAIMLEIKFDETMATNEL